MSLFGRRRSSGPPLEERLAAFRAEQGGGHDLALLERRAEAALAESGLEWEEERRPSGERTWKLSTEVGTVSLFTSVHGDALSLNQTVREADELDLDGALVRGLLQGNAGTEGPNAALEEAAEEGSYNLLLQALVPLEALDPQSLRAALDAFLRRRGALETGEEPATEPAANRLDRNEDERRAAAAAVEGLSTTLGLGLEPDSYAWRLGTDLPDVGLELDLFHDVLRVTIPIVAADGVREEREFLAYFLERGGLFSSFYAIVPHRRESWVAAMSTVPTAGLTPELVAFALESPLRNARSWRDA